MTAIKFKGYIIELVVKNGLPLSVFSSPGFIGLSGEMAAKLGVSLEWHNIRKRIFEEANNKKNCWRRYSREYSSEDGRMHTVNYFGINVQLVNENKEMIIRIWVLKDTKAQHASEQFYKLIENVLKDFEIKKENILIIVTVHRTW